MGRSLVEVKRLQGQPSRRFFLSCSFVERAEPRAQSGGHYALPCRVIAPPHGVHGVDGCGDALRSERIGPLAPGDLKISVEQDMFSPSFV